MKRMLSALAVCLMLILAVARPALAMDEPDSVLLHDIEVFHDLIVEGDFLVVVPYDIPFTTQPDNDIDETFIFTMVSNNSTAIIGTISAYPRYNGGYGQGVVSFYFSANVTLDQPYKFRVQENPSYYPTPEYWEFIIGESNYATEDNQDEALRAKILDIAGALSTEWEVDLLTTSDAGQTVFTTYGELYFLNAVPGVQAMCPNLFAVQLESPTYTKRSWSLAIAEALRTKYNGTIIADFMTGFAGMVSVDTPSAMNVMSILLFAALIIVAMWKFKATTISAFQDGYSLLLLLMLDSFFSMIIAGMMAFLALVLGGVILFLNRS